MKKFILLATSVSFLCAGPLVQPIVDYDKEDLIEAETQVEQKLTLPPAVIPEVTTPGVRKKSFNYELDLLAGRNFADDGSVLKDATMTGIRLNRFITDTVAIQLGYDRIFDADYKFGKSLRTFRNHGAVEDPVVGCGDDAGDIDNGSQNGGGDIDDGNHDQEESGNNGTGNETSGGDGGDNGTGNGEGSGGNGEGSGDNGNGSGNGGTDGGNGGTDGNGETGDNPLSEKGLQNATRSTDIDRFYLNVVKEVHSEKSNFIPYAFAGLGYEHVNDKNLGIDSQGFFNAGGGLKYSIGEKFRLVSEAKAIKKFKDDDLDIVAMVGVGMLFGQKESAPQQQMPDLDIVEPKPQTQDLSLVMIDDTSPVAVQEEPAVDRTAVVQTLIAEESTSPAPDAQVPLSDNAYYVQVAVVKTESSLNNYLTKLKKSGLSYEVKPVKVRGSEAHRVLVGPYLSRSEASEDMRRIKKIEKGAFIKQL